MYFGMFTTLNECQKNPTIRQELKSQKDIYYGFVGYPISQAADFLLFTTTPPKFSDELLVPVGEDQAPHLETTRNIARRFNKIYGETFIIPNCEVSDFSRLPGLDMRKMGKSAGSHIHQRRAFVPDDYRSTEI